MTTVLKGKHMGVFVIDNVHHVLYVHAAKCGVSGDVIAKAVIPVVKLGGKNPSVVEVKALIKSLAERVGGSESTVRENRLYKLYKDAISMYENGSHKLTNDQINKLIRAWENLDNPVFAGVID